VAEDVVVVLSGGLDERRRVCHDTLAGQVFFVLEALHLLLRGENCATCSLHGLVSALQALAGTVGGEVCQFGRSTCLVDAQGESLRRVVAVRLAGRLEFSLCPVDFGELSIELGKRPRLVADCSLVSRLARRQPAASLLEW
jgi:hypothetical protein